MLRGEYRCRPTDDPPEFSPNNVIDSGFPPNFTILFLIHFNAATWSFKPRFPGKILSAVLVNPFQTKKKKF